MKDSGSTIELEADAVKLHSASEMTLEAVRDVLLSGRSNDSCRPRSSTTAKSKKPSKGTVRQTAQLRQGLSQDLAREITKLISDRLPKLKTQIQGDAVRVTGKSKDELQAAISSCAKPSRSQLARCPAVRQLSLSRRGQPEEFTPAAQGVRFARGRVPSLAAIELSMRAVRASLGRLPAVECRHLLVPRS